MSFLNALGAVGSGVSAGIQDLREMDDAKFRKEQQQRQRDEWDAEKADTAAMAGIDPKLQGAARYRAMAETLAKSKSTAAQTRALQMAAHANQLEQSDMALRQQHVQNALGTAGFLHGAGDYRGALNVLNGAYGLVPDGHQFVIDDKAGTVGVANQSGKWVMPPSAINADTVGKMIETGQMYKNPELWKAIKTVGQKDTEIAQTGQHYKDVGQHYRDDASYKQGVLGIHQDELAAKKAAGYFQKDHPFTPIGLSDDNKRILGRQGSGLREQAIPEGYSGLFPKVTGAGAKPSPTRWDKADDGTYTAHGADGKPLWNILEGGVEAPLGVSNTRWMDIQKQAKKAGVSASIGKRADGTPGVAYLGRDGEYYDNIEEAKAAKPTKK